MRSAIGYRLSAIALVACGSSTPPQKPAGPPAQMTAAPGSDDAIVAHVNGRPVFASCVTAQGSAHHLTARAALDECIAFELMAQEAERRGLATDPEVAYATKTALVSRLLATSYEDALQDPKIFGDVWTTFLSKYDWHVRHDAYRGSTYVRYPVPKGASADVDAKAHAQADQLAALVANEHGLMSASFRDLAQKLTGPLVTCTKESTTPCYQDVDPLRKDAIDPEYGKALFALTELGRATPAVRSEWGWDVIVWTEDVPETRPTDAEVARDMLPEFKQFYFGPWVHEIEKRLGVKVQVMPDAYTILGSSL